ncbi:VOC family protein [Trujillonella humicola]|uniref:VOC family protein n=1 Tax=Trujillonella humicola TaxID=3383699 RepID=UPI0039068679
MTTDARTVAQSAAGAAHHAHSVMHCNLNSADDQRSVAFYMAALDVEPRMRSVSTDGDSTFMGLFAGTASITTFLYDRRGPRAAPALELVGWSRPATEPAGPDAVPPVYTGVGYRTTDLRVVRSRLVALGAEVETVDGGVRARGRTWPALRTTDPDGVPVEVLEVPAAEGDPVAGAFAFVRLRSSDLDRTAAWFGAIGWEARGDRGPAGGEHLSLVLPEDPTFSLEFSLAPAAPAGAVPRRANTQGLYRMALAVEDVAAARASLVASGVAGEVPEPEFVPMPDTPTGGFTVLFLKGPDATVVELVDRPRSTVRRPLQPQWDSPA